MHADAVESQHPITSRLVNDDGETYFVVIDVHGEDAAEFLQAMWKHVDPRYYPQGDDILREWTDRMRDVRSTYNSRGVCVRTHAWHPQGDRHALHEKVVEFFISRGLEI